MSDELFMYRLNFDRERERERERERGRERSPLDVNYYCQLSILEKSDIKTTEL